MQYFSVFTLSNYEMPGTGHGDTEMEVRLTVHSDSTKLPQFAKKGFCESLQRPVQPNMYPD